MEKQNNNQEDKNITLAEAQISAMLEAAAKKAEEMTSKMIADVEEKAARIIEEAEEKAAIIITDARQTAKPERVIKEEPKVRIKLPYDKAKNNSDLPVSINGITYLIQRGVWVEVPLSVAEVLENANRQEEYAIRYSEGLVDVFAEKLKTM